MDIRLMNYGIYRGLIKSAAFTELGTIEGPPEPTGTEHEVHESFRLEGRTVLSAFVNDKSQSVRDVAIDDTILRIMRLPAFTTPDFTD